MKLSRYIYISKADCINNGQEKFFLFSTRSSLSILVDTNTLTKLQCGNFSELCKTQISKLEKYKILVSKDEDEFETICKENLASKISSDILSFTVQPTSNCQFGCHYCGQEHSPHTMDERVENFCLYRVRAAILRNNKYKRLAITWYGGEPLLGIKALKKLSTKLMELCNEIGLMYRADMVTNGYLLRKEVFLELLTVHHVKDYQITLDGVAKTHDNRRVLKANRGKTFDLIYSNIKQIVCLPEYTKYNAHISIRINIDKTNFHEVNELLHKLIEDNIANKVYVSFAPIEDWGGNDAGKASFSHAEFSELHMQWIKYCIEHNIRVAKLIPSRNFGTCMIETKDGEVFDAYGHTYPCWEFPYSAYKGAEHMISSLDNPDTLKNEKVTLLDFSKKMSSGEYECSDCVFFPLCGGGCPLALYEGRNACPTYKFDIGQRLLLDYEIRKRKNEIDEQN